MAIYLFRLLLGKMIAILGYVIVVVFILCIHIDAKYFPHKPVDNVEIINVHETKLTYREEIEKEELEKEYPKMSKESKDFLLKKSNLDVTQRQPFIEREPFWLNKALKENNSSLDRDKILAELIVVSNWGNDDDIFYTNNFAKIEDEDQNIYLPSDKGKTRYKSYFLNEDFYKDYIKKLEDKDSELYKNYMKETELKKIIIERYLKEIDYY